MTEEDLHSLLILNTHIMAPQSHKSISYSENNKIQRDKLNRSIGHLRVLFHKTTRQFVKLDEADILEMTVGFLKLRANSSYSRGFSQCLQETLRHVSLHAHLTHDVREAIKRFYVLQRTNQLGLARRSPKPSSSRASLWRPWKNN